MAIKLIFGVHDMHGKRSLADLCAANIEKFLLFLMLDSKFCFEFP
jgi:hypothetical protein